MAKNEKTNYLTLRQFGSKHPWPSESALRGIIQNSETNGFREAFIRYGRRILIKEDIFFKCLENINTGLFKIKKQRKKR